MVYSRCYWIISNTASIRKEPTTSGTVGSLDGNKAALKPKNRNVKSIKRYWRCWGKDTASEIPQNSLAYLYRRFRGLRRNFWKRIEVRLWRNSCFSFLVYRLWLMRNRNRRVDWSLATAVIWTDAAESVMRYHSTWGYGVKFGKNKCHATKVAA